MPNIGFMHQSSKHITNVCTAKYHIILSFPEHILLITLSVGEGVTLLELCLEFERVTALALISFAITESTLSLRFLSRIKIGWGDDILKLEQRTEWEVPSCNWTICWKLQQWCSFRKWQKNGELSDEDWFKSFALW